MAVGPIETNVFWNVTSYYVMGTLSGKLNAIVMTFTFK